MNGLWFEGVLREVLEQTEHVLGKKAKEYASDVDRLHNFKRAADVLQTTPEAALAGFMTKHWVSILDMIDGVEKGVIHPTELWNEKIYDSINYLILLKALVTERHTINAAQAEITEVNKRG
jgi:hypothetical protein